MLSGCSYTCTRAPVRVLASVCWGPGPLVTFTHWCPSSRAPLYMSRAPVPVLPITHPGLIPALPITHRGGNSCTSYYASDWFLHFLSHIRFWFLNFPSHIRLWFLHSQSHIRLWFLHCTRFHTYFLSYSGVWFPVLPFDPMEPCFLHSLSTHQSPLYPHSLLNPFNQLGFFK